MKTINDEIMIKFKMHLYEEEKSINTIEKYMRDIRFFREWLNGKSIDKSVVLDYKKILCEKYAPKSVNSVLSSLNALFVFMNRHELKVKTLKIQRQIFADKERELTKNEYKRLLNTAKSNKRLCLLMQTICSCGIRISELKFITVEAVKKGRADITCKNKRRTVFLPKQLCRMLIKYIAKNKIITGSVFVSRNGNPLDRSNVWSDMKKLCERAGVKKGKVFPHNLRHLFARTYYSLQKDIVRLADLLGHSNINTTRIYTVESGDVHRNQIQLLGLLCS